MRILSAIDVTPSLPSSSLGIAEAPEKSPLHSPVPYLFGGLTAMLILIAFALLILACSYWKISGCLGRRRRNHFDQTVEEKPSQDESIKVYEEKFVVIMAGDEIPTFLATPICIKGSTFEADLYSINDQDKKDDDDDDDDDEIETPKGEDTPLPPSTITTTAAAAATETESIDQMVHHQIENRVTQEENPDQHQTH